MIFETVEKDTQNSIVEAIRRMHEGSERNYPSTVLLVSEKKFKEIKELPGYSSDTLFGKKVINGERGKLEGLVVVVSDNMLVTDLEIDV